MQKNIPIQKKHSLKFHQYRTQKHVSDPMNNSAAKRINMLMGLNKVYNYSMN
jgi:hypothetical protein